MPQIDLGKVIGPQGPQGVVGPAGPQGPVGAAATINGVQALTLALSDGLTGGQTAEGVYTISAADLCAPDAGAHNAIYRGMSLGNAVTEAQYTAIADGTFRDLYIGDYWWIDGVGYRIAAFDYYLRCGDTETTAHHIVVVPDSSLYAAKMNETDTTEGGYVGSKLYTEGLEQAKTTIKAAFNGHVLKHRVYLINAVTNGRPSAGAWCDSEVDLMNEQMMYGGPLFMQLPDGTNATLNTRVEKSQLPLFTHRPDLISNRRTFCLRDVVSATRFAAITMSGTASDTNASNLIGVRPYACIF